VAEVVTDLAGIGQQWSAQFVHAALFKGVFASN